MWYQQQSEDYRPLFWVSGRPVYANMLLVIAHVVLFVVGGILIAFLGSGVVESALRLYTPGVWQGEVWRLVTYVFFDPAFFGQGSLWFLFNMLLLYFFGREVEQLVGRKSYLGLYAGLILVPSILLSVLGLLTRQPLEYMTCADAVFGVFIAFATIYPGAMPSMWISVPVWIIAWVLLSIFTFLDFVNNHYLPMFMLWTCSAVAYLGMRWVGAGRGANWLTDWIETRRAQRLARKHQFKVLTERKSNESIDAILDKISKQGVNSLNSSERAALERARTKLIDRDRG
jgi:membrane associated rhomboid family serine protease